jgi:ADP-ribose pyrophosphatase
MTMARTVLRDVLRTRLSPYVTLVERRVEIGGRIEAFHSLAQADYVTVLAVASDGHIPLVRQYRPALDREFLELPGGLLEAGEAPADCAARELAEEAGFRLRTPLRLLGQLDPDSGRLENKLWAFLATDVEPTAGWQPEDGVQRILADRTELLAAITEGRFTHALHIAIVGMALATGVF